MLPAVQRALEEAEERKDHRKGDGPSSPIKQIWQQHHEVIRLAVLGFGVMEIARMVGFTPAMIRNILGSEVVKRQMEVMVGAKDFDCLELKKEIESLAPLAIDVLRGIMENDNESSRNRLAAATDILDRAGFAPPRVIQGTLSISHITSSELDELKQRAREAQMIDVTPQLPEGGL